MNVPDALALADDLAAVPDKLRGNAYVVAAHTLAAEVRRLTGATAHGYTCRCGLAFATQHGFKVHVGRLGTYEHGVARYGRVTGAETDVQAQARIAAAQALYDDGSPRKNRR